MTTCPACQHDIQEGAQDCPYCGVVFAKWKALRSGSGAHPLARQNPSTGPVGLGFWLPPLILGLIASGMLIVKIINGKFTPGPLGDNGWSLALLAVCVLSVVCGVAVFGGGLAVNRRKRLMGNVQIGTIGSLRPGLVVVTGITEADGRVLQAPCSQKQCVYFSYNIEEHNGKTGMDADWDEFARGESDQSFYVRDHTGRVRIDPRGGRFFLQNDKRGVRTSTVVLPQGRFTTGRFMCNESFLPVGKTVYILGTAQEDPEAESTADPTERLYIGASKDRVFQVSDRSLNDLDSHTTKLQFARMFYGGAALTVASLYAILACFVVPLDGLEVRSAPGPNGNHPAFRISLGKFFSHNEAQKPKQVPDFQLSTIEGIEYSNQSLSGKPALLFFWAPWCPYCQAELPKLAQYYQHGKPEELRVLAFGIKDTQAAVTQYIINNSNTFPFPSVYDVNDRVAKAIGVHGVPRYFLLDSHGNIVEGGFKEEDNSGKFVIDTAVIGSRIEEIITSPEFQRTLAKSK